MITKQTTFSAFSTASAEKTPKEFVLLRSRAGWLVVLFFSSTLGLLSGIFGLGLSVLSLFGFFQIKSSVSSTTTILVAVSFPLLFLAAHCLDKIREAEKRVKLEYCKRLGTYQPFIED